jgi:hypothetical protein
MDVATTPTRLVDPGGALPNGWVERADGSGAVALPPHGSSGSVPGVTRRCTSLVIRPSDWANCPFALATSRRAPRTVVTTRSRADDAQQVDPVHDARQEVVGHLDLGLAGYGARRRVRRDEETLPLPSRAWALSPLPRALALVRLLPYHALRGRFVSPRPAQPGCDPAVRMLARLRLFDPGFHDFRAKSTPRSKASI